MDKEKYLNLRKRLMSGLVAAGIAVGGYATSFTDTLAEKQEHEMCCDECDEALMLSRKSKKSVYGSYVDELTGKEYNTVLVREGDNASKLSSRIVHYFIENNEVPKQDKEMYNDDYNTRARFWPVVVYLNTPEGEKYHSKVGEKFVFPKTYEELTALNVVLKKSGWYSDYVQKNRIYQKRKNYKVPKEKVRKFIEEIYREIYGNPNFIVDDNLLDAYLRAHSYDGDFTFDPNSKISYEEQVILTEWIPTLEELDEYTVGKPKIKVHK